MQVSGGIDWNRSTQSFYGGSAVRASRIPLLVERGMRLFQSARRFVHSFYAAGTARQKTANQRRTIIPSESIELKQEDYHR
jgi:hypothetical protein